MGLRTRRPLPRRSQHRSPGDGAGSSLRALQISPPIPNRYTHSPHSPAAGKHCSRPPLALPGCTQLPHTLSKPFSSSFLPRTSPIPARLPTGFSPMGSATKSRCFWEVVILIRLNLGILRKGRLWLKTRELSKAHWQSHSKRQLEHPLGRLSRFPPVYG